MIFQNLKALRFFIKHFLIILCSLFLLTACIVGPDYVRPPSEIPEKYKEAKSGWKIAHPMDNFERGYWWEIFNDHELNELEPRVNISNYNVAAAEAQYAQARAFVAEAIAAFYPTLSATASVTYQKLSQSGVSVATASGQTIATGNATGSAAVTTSTGGVAATTTAGQTATVGTSGGRGGQPFATYVTQLQAVWEPDLWGLVHREVEASKAQAQSLAAAMANIELSMQATLAQDYFQLRELDALQVVLDSTVIANRKILNLVVHSYHSGVSSVADIAQADQQLKTAEALAIDNRVSRALMEHAIAVLIGVTPSNFKLPPLPLRATPPPIPVEIPSELLERRPDIAQAERLIAQANAQIGVAIAAYYPTLTLTGFAGFQANSLSNLFSLPSLFWSIGANLTQYVFDGGLRIAQTAAARANYYSTVAQYRQTVLTAFQDVEDNLATLRILQHEAVVQAQAVKAARVALNLQMHDFSAGTVPYNSVLTAQITTNTVEQTAINIAGRRMVAAVLLIKALGGGWDEKTLALTGEVYVCSKHLACHSTY